MKCERCGKEYPSEYYFKTDTVCLDCFGTMSAEERKGAVYHSLMKHPIRPRGPRRRHIILIAIPG